MDLIIGIVDENSKEFGDKPIVYTDAVIEIEDGTDWKISGVDDNSQNSRRKNRQILDRQHEYPEFKQGEPYVYHIFKSCKKTIKFRINFHFVCGASQASVCRDYTSGCPSGIDCA